jgi:hypothetical protein
MWKARSLGLGSKTLVSSTFVKNLPSPSLMCREGYIIQTEAKISLKKKNSADRKY